MKKTLPWILISPTLAMITIFFIAAVIITIPLAFTNMGLSFKWTFNGIQNFESFMRDPLIPTVIINTFIFVALTLTLFNFGMALLLSLLTTSINDKWGNFFRTIWMLPRITPSVVFGLLWLWIFDPGSDGLLNILLRYIGIGQQDIFHHAPMVLIVLANGYVGASMGMMIFSSAIKSIPIEYYRAASVDGAGWFYTTRRVTLPLIKWHLLFITAYETLSLFTSYEYIYIITNGGPINMTNVWALYTYQTAFSNFSFGYAAALSLVLVVIGIVTGFIYLKGINIQINTKNIEL